MNAIEAHQTEQAAQAAQNAGDYATAAELYRHAAASWHNVGRSLCIKYIDRCLINAIACAAISVHTSDAKHYSNTERQHAEQLLARVIDLTINRKKTMDTYR